MNTERYRLTTLRELFAREKVATFEQVRAALGNPARCTVFRKLEALGYLSSYSDRGKHYTLPSEARFGSEGLWRRGRARFSRFGNLLETCEAFVRRSEAGYTAAELKEALGVKTKHALTQLARNGRLAREKLGTAYVYFSGERREARGQRRARRVRSDVSSADLAVANPDLAVEEAKAAILLFYGMLDEKQRRLYAGLESLKLGHGGDSHIASVLGLDAHTVARGRRELVARECRVGSVRAPGGGRPAREKKRPR